jgi:hypothetical protein
VRSGGKILIAGAIIADVFIKSRLFIFVFFTLLKFNIFYNLQRNLM